MSKIRFRKHVSIPGLLSTIRTSFAAVQDPVKHRGFTLVDCLMSGIAVFKFKAPSLLYFDRIARGEKVRSSVVGNLKTLFGVEQAPSDTCLRERLDMIDPVHLRPAFRRILANLQRSRGLLQSPLQVFGHGLAVSAGPAGNRPVGQSLLL